MKNVCTCCFLLFLFLTSCTDQQRDDPLRSFYFPLEKLKEPHVYIYQPAPGIDRPPYFMIKQSSQVGDSLFLDTWTLDHNLLLQYVSRQKVVNNGVKAKNYELVQIDTSGKVRKVTAEIESADIFPFEKQDSNQLYIFKMKWYPDVDSSRHNTLIRNRWQKGPATYFYQNEELPSYVFGVKEIVDQYQEGYIQYEARGEEIYVKNVGLVSIDKSIGDEYRLAFRLDTIFRLTDFEKDFEVEINLPGSAF